MHRIAKLKIENFRSCGLLEIDLRDFTPIVGPNNAGKSNIIRALKWAISPWSLKEEDFYRNAPEAPVQITLTIEDINEDILNTLESKHAAAIEPFLDNETLVLRRTQSKPGIPARQIELEVMTPNTDQYKSNPTGIPAAIKAVFPDPIHVEAMTDAAADAAKNTASSTIGKLLKLVIEGIQERYAGKISEAMRPLRELLSADGTGRAEELDELDRDTNDALASLFPGIEAQIHVPEPTLDVAFKAATVLVKENGGLSQDFSYLGHGAQRSVQMALIQALAKRQRAGGTGQCILLLIDEPELYLHPQAIEQVREALLTLSEGDFQVVFSTHSPQMIQPDDVPHTLILRKNGQGSACESMAATVGRVIQDNGAQAEILFSLSGNSQILFCENVLLAEGKTEQQLLPFLYRKHHGTSMGAHRLGFIPLSGCENFDGSLAILAAMGIPAKALADFDYACRGGRNCGLCPCDPDDLKTCLDYIKTLADEGKVTIDENGLPKKDPNKNGQQLDAAGAFKKCVADPDCAAAVSNICAAAKKNGVWVWRHGDMEGVLGLQNKKNSTRLSFKKDVENAGIDATVPHADELKAFLDWVRPE